MGAFALALALVAPSCNGFVAPATSQQGRVVGVSTTAIMSMAEPNVEASSRRSVLSLLFTSTVAATAGASVLFPSKALAEAETMERGGVKLTPFNSLAFNYRGTLLLSFYKFVTSCTLCVQERFRYSMYENHLN